MIIEIEPKQPEMKLFKKDLESFYDHDLDEFAFKDVETQRKKTKTDKNEIPKGQQQISAYFTKSCKIFLVLVNLHLNFLN